MPQLRKQNTVALLSFEINLGRSKGIHKIYTLFSEESYIQGVQKYRLYILGVILEKNIKKFLNNHNAQKNGHILKSVILSDEI